MIEEIRKEILAVFKSYDWINYEIFLRIGKVLEKHSKEEQSYKTMWEELKKELYYNRRGNKAIPFDKGSKDTMDVIDELEQKHLNKEVK